MSSWSRAPGNRHAQFQSGRKTSVWLVTGYAGAGFWLPVPLQVESGWPSSLGYLEVELRQAALEGRTWEVLPTPSFTEGNLGPGQAGDLTQVILVSGIAKTRVGSFTSSPRVLSGNY